MVPRMASSFCSLLDSSDLRRSSSCFMEFCEASENWRMAFWEASDACFWFCASSSPSVRTEACKVSAISRLSSRCSVWMSACIFKNCCCNRSSVSSFLLFDWRMSRMTARTTVTADSAIAIYSIKNLLLTDNIVYYTKKAKKAQGAEGITHSARPLG